MILVVAQSIGISMGISMGGVVVGGGHGGRGGGGDGAHLAVPDGGAAANGATPTPTPSQPTGQAFDEKHRNRHLLREK